MVAPVLDALDRRAPQNGRSFKDLQACDKAITRNISAQDEIAFDTPLAGDFRINRSHGLFKMFLQFAGVDRDDSPPGFLNSSADFLDESFLDEVAFIDSLARTPIRRRRRPWDKLHPRRRHSSVRPCVGLANLQHNISRDRFQMENFAAPIYIAFAV